MSVTETPIALTSVAVDAESDALSGKLSYPTEWHLARRILGAVREWWVFSRHRVVVNEIRKILLRISAILKDSLLKYGPAVPSDPRQHGQMSFRQASIFGLSCSHDVGQLSRKYPWMGDLDQQLAAEAYQLGAAWAFRILDSCNKTDGKELHRP
jgi:hypothetical protein